MGECDHWEIIDFGRYPTIAPAGTEGEIWPCDCSVAHTGGALLLTLT